MDEVKKIITDIKKGNFSPIYFLCGDEPYYIDAIADALTEHVIDKAFQDFNLQIIYGKDTDIDTIINYAKQYPMMSPQRLIVVKEAQNLNRSLQKLLPYLEKPSSTTILVFCYKYDKIEASSKLGKALKKYIFFTGKKLYDNQVSPWITAYLKDQSYNITPMAAQMLADYLGTDLSRIVNEINKLKIILPSGTQITPDHIEKNIGISKDFNVFELQKALATKNLVKSIQIVNYFAHSGETGIIPMVVASLYNYFEKLLIYHAATDKSDANLATLLKVHPFLVKEYHTAAKNFSPMRKVSQVIEHIRRIDLKSKGIDRGSATDQNLLHELVIDILST